MSIYWRRKNQESPVEEESRILIYSPKYEGKDFSMLYRIVSTQFLKFCHEASHWAYLKAPTDIEESDYND